MKKAGKLNLNRETLRDLDREALNSLVAPGLRVALGGSLDTGSTHITVSNTVSTVGSGSCRP